MMRNNNNKPVGDWISAPSPNFVAMATRVGLTTFCIVPLNRQTLKTPWYAQTSPVYHTSQLIGDFVQLQILGSKFWALGA